MQNFHSSVLAALKEAKEQLGSVAALAAKTGVNPVTLGRWFTGQRNPTVIEVGKVFDALGIKFNPLAQVDAGKDVCFVDAKLMPAGEYVRPPQAEDYLAAPLVGEVGAGPGYVAQEDVKSWFLVYRHHPAIQYRRNLLAVEIGKNSTSMTPLLKPGDLVLVDRDDRDVSRSGHIMLVKDPDDQGMIKRVSVEQQDDGDYAVVYYSDNAMENPPICYSLRRDFFNDWERAIVGRVIWAWSDVREK